MAHLKTNTQMCGYISGKPRLATKKSGGVYLTGFTIKSQPNRKFPPLYMPVACFAEELAVYIAERYKDGSWLEISRGSLVPDTRKDFRGACTLLIWDIVDESLHDVEHRDSEDQHDNNDEEYIAH